MIKRKEDYTPELLFANREHPEVTMHHLLNSRKVVEKKWSIEIENDGYGFEKELQAFKEAGLPLMLGIDASLNCTGICLTNGEKYLTGFIIPGSRLGINGKVLRTAKHLTRHEKQAFIYDAFKELLRPVKSLISHVGIEGMAYNARSNTLIDMAIWRGKIEAAIHDMCPKAKTVVISPAKLKSVATGSARSSKDDMMDAARLNFRIDFEPDEKNFKVDDEVDAFMITKVVEEMRKGRTFNKLKWVKI